MQWPKGGGVDPYYPVYFVRWRGTMEGPGWYGHMGISPYLLRVTEILEVRNAGRNDCPR